MDITIDTTHPLNDRDRAILRALLDGTPGPVTGPVTVNVANPTTPPGQRPNTAAALAAAVTREAAGGNTAARRAVAQQPGVTLTESTPEAEPAAG